MKTFFRGFSRRFLCAFLIGAAVLLSGCLEKRLVWSRDGNRAAVIAKDGALFLCDRDGRLQKTPFADVNLAEWVGDSQRLIVSRQFETSDWSTVAPLLGEKRALVEAEAARLRSALLGGGKWTELIEQAFGRPSMSNSGSPATKLPKNVVLMCLRERHGTDIQSKLTAEEWHGISSGHTKVAVTEMSMTRVEGELLVPGTVLQTTLAELRDLRSSPDGRTVAMTFSSDEDDDFQALQVMRLDEPGARPVPIARFAAAYPDWTKDSRSLVYIEAQNVDAKGTSGLGLGALTQREVVDSSGKIVVAKEASYSAVAIFSGFARVRCLADGRILFNSAELTLPLSTVDLNGEHRDQLYVVDPSRQATLVRMIPRGKLADLPQMLSFFEVSPDGTQVVFAGTKSETVVFTLATGAVEVIQDSGESLFQGTPSWRGAGELTYVRRSREKDGVKPARPAEIVIRTAGTDKEFVLSKDWPDDVLALVASEDRK